MRFTLRSKLHFYPLSWAWKIVRHLFLLRPFSLNHFLIHVCPSVVLACSRRETRIQRPVERVEVGRRGRYRDIADPISWTFCKTYIYSTQCNTKGSAVAWDFSENLIHSEFRLLYLFHRLHWLMWISLLSRFSTSNALSKGSHWSHDDFHIT